MFSFAGRYFGTNEISLCGDFLHSSWDSCICMCNYSNFLLDWLSTDWIDVFIFMLVLVITQTACKFRMGT